MAVLKTKDVAEKLGLTPARVNQLCAEGKLPAYRTHGDSGHWRFDSEQVFKQHKLPDAVLPEKQTFVEADTSIFNKIKQQVRGNS